MKEPRPQYHPATLLLPNLEHKKFYARFKKPQIHSKPVQYQSDGTGRDSYVKMTNGGLSQPTQRVREYRQAFRNSLRAYQPIPSSYYLDKREARQANRHSMVVNRTTLNMIKQRTDNVEDFVPGYNAEDPTAKHVGSKNVRNLTFQHSPQASRDRGAEDGDPSPEGKSVTREHTRNSIEGSPEGRRSSAGRGSALRLSTAPQTVNRIKLARHVGELSADNFVHGALAASVFGSLPPEEVAKHLRVSVEKGLHKDNLNSEEQWNIGTYLRSLDKRLSMPKHRRSSASSNEDAGPAQISRNRYVKAKGSLE